MGKEPRFSPRTRQIIIEQMRKRGSVGSRNTQSGSVVRTPISIFKNPGPMPPVKGKVPRSLIISGLTDSLSSTQMSDKSSTIFGAPRLSSTPNNHLRISRHSPKMSKFSRPGILTPSKLAIRPQRAKTSGRKENIKVVVRVRPPNGAESGTAHRTVVEVEDMNTLVFDPAVPSEDFYFHGKIQTNSTTFKRHKETRFVFDRVFGKDSSNHDVYRETIQQNLDALLEGFNCSIFAYGATGSGKTFTMLGSGAEHPGLTLLTVNDLYERLKKIQTGYAATLSVSYLEVYNEAVRDLLTRVTPARPGGLSVSEDQNGVSISNLTWIKPQNQDHLLKLLSDGNHRRTQHATDHNSESSRSHAVFQVEIAIKANLEDDKCKLKTAKLVMVDLAGSERASATQFSAHRSREGAMINKSLLALGSCINALADGKTHVPYRNSKLTHILKYCLGGNCKSIIIANVSPSSMSYDDTYNTLKYADRAKHIKANAKKNESFIGAKLADYSEAMKGMQAQIDYLQDVLSTYANCTCRVSTDSGDKQAYEPVSQAIVGQEEVKVRTPLQPSQKENRVSWSPRIQDFRKLKENCLEVKDSLSLMNRTIANKTVRQAHMAKNLDDHAPQAARRITKELSTSQSQRQTLEAEVVAGEKAVSEALNDVPSNALTTIPVRELMRLTGVEAQLQSVLCSRDKEKDYLQTELDETYSLLNRYLQETSNILVIGRSSHPSYDTLNKAFNDTRSEFFRLKNQKRVRFTEALEPHLGAGDDKENLNRTFTK